MDFITFSLDDMMHTDKFTSIMQPHLLISIRSHGQVVNLPKNHYTQATLNLEFDDITLVTGTDYYFDADLARKILEFVNAHCAKANLIVCHCQAGLSRSAAVCAALSKIINNRDDMYFANKIPNILVYASILEEYFLTPEYDRVYRALWYLRERSLKELLPINVLRLAKSRIPKKQDLESTETANVVGD